MKLYSENKNYKLYQGNMLDMLEVIEKESVDSIITDPPYELNFMGKGWDNSGIAFQKETWQKCYEVLKPGGYLLAFGGSRTFHRIACAIEDAGFEIRDTIMWLYGSGFPKSLNIGLAIDKKNGVEREIIGYKPAITKGNSKWEGWGTALKPSFEPIIVARKPFKGSLADNVIEYGVGGINIDECRVPFVNEKDNTLRPLGNSCYQKGNKIVNRGEITGTRKLYSEIGGSADKGRFPANTILTYDENDFDEVCGGFPYNKSSLGPAYYKGNYTKNGWKNTSMKNTSKVIYNDSGSASRYFYCAKASKKDRDEGLDEFEEIDGGSYQFRQDGSLDGKIPVRKNTHPTVKPTELMQYLVRLVSPEGATILDPFNGSGSTGKAVMYENKERNKNYKYIGIELTEEYLPIAKARIEYVCRTPLEILKEQTEKIAEGQTNIFDFIGDDNY